MLSYLVKLCTRVLCHAFLHIILEVLFDDVEGVLVTGVGGHVVQVHQLMSSIMIHLGPSLGLAP